MPDAIYNLDDLYSVVMELWPTCRETKASVQVRAWHRLQQYTAQERDTALRRHRFEYPDASRPTWSLVFQSLASTSHAARPSCEFQAFLDSWRRTGRKAGVKGVDDWTDADTWQHYLDSLTYPILFNTLTGHVKPDDEPCTHCAYAAERYSEMGFRDCGRMRLACSAQRTRENEADRWLAYFDRVNKQPPAYLEM